ncbi:MAG: hypothetical protein ACRDPY_06925 [Streptosporangiaceae bacterium]
MLTRKVSALLAIALLPLLLLTACSHATRPAAPPVTMGYCGSNLQVKPDVILVVCNTDDITATSLKWSGWGNPLATAKGTATIDVCAYSDCANGAYTYVPIEMIASKIVGCTKKARAYSTLRYVFPNGSPWPGIPADTNMSDSLGAPARPLPPKDQTVSLTC